MFDDAEIAATRDDTAGVTQFLANMLNPLPKFHEQTVEEARAGIPGLPEPEVLAHGVTRSIPGPGGDIDLRIFAPENPVGIYLHIHGGGWVIGSALTADVKLDAIASGANVVVVSVEYRLAPEHPFPAPNEDCEAAALWVLANAESEWGLAGDMVIGGESAGGHLVADTALRLRDSHGAIDQVRGLNLVYGVFDLSMTPSQTHGTDLLLIPTDTMKWFYGHYLQGDEDPKSPAVSPLYADVSDMPPALFSVGTNDPLVDDSLFMARRWELAGNQTTLNVYPGAVHGFTVLPGEAGLLANQRGTEFIAGCFGG
ncbi:MAG: acetyl esterase [Candidatus Poriferisodalaceae bacterium]|jgi:acetyl esterase